MTRTRPATPTVAFIDQYCGQYRSLFKNVRHFEHFTALHLGLLAETRHKSLPQLGKTVHADPQALHHVLANASWSVEDLRAKRLELLHQALGQTPCILCLDETGDRKKGQTTDYVAHQYIGNLHTLANGVVSVNAYGLLGTTTFPLLFRVFKPEPRLKPGDVYKTKPQLAVAIIEELLARGFRFRVVLADALYGESPEFIRALHRLQLQYVVALRANHGVWLLPGQPVRQTRWRPFERVFTDGSSAQRFIRETVYAQRQAVRYYQITTDPATLPPETTWDLLTNQPGKIERTVGNTFGLRTWVEDGFKHRKDDLGWADYRLTDYARIARWWELVMSAYTLVSLQTPDFAALGHIAPAPTTAEPTSTEPASTEPASTEPVPAAPPPAIPLEAHPAWDTGNGWKHHLNNLRLLLQPYVCSCLLLPWLHLVPLPQVQAVHTGLAALGSLVDTFRLTLPT
jgi:SRSO17 transposase